MTKSDCTHRPTMLCRLCFSNSLERQCYGTSKSILKVLLLCFFVPLCGRSRKTCFTSDCCGIFPLSEGGLDPFYSDFEYVLLTNERRRVELRCKVPPRPGAGAPVSLVQVLSSLQAAVCPVALGWLRGQQVRGFVLAATTNFCKSLRLFNLKMSADKRSVWESGRVIAGDAAMRFHRLIRIWCGSTLAGRSQIGWAATETLSVTARLWMQVKHRATSRAQLHPAWLQRAFFAHLTLYKEACVSFVRISVLKFPNKASEMEVKKLDAIIRGNHSYRYIYIYVYLYSFFCKK